MNKLKEYLIENKIRAKDFAKKCGVVTSTISQISNDKGGVSLSLAFKIQRLTNDIVKIDFFDKWNEVQPTGETK